jgi:hypothetical protein
MSLYTGIWALLFSPFLVLIPLVGLFLKKKIPAFIILNCFEGKNIGKVMAVLKHLYEKM